MTSVEKARTTRERLQAAQTEAIREKQAANAAARLALTRLFEAPDATAEQLLEGARLLVKMNERY